MIKLMIRQEIIKLIQKATGRPAEEILIERPKEKSNGDYSTNIAIQLKTDSAALAAKLKSDIFEKVEAVPPGFINFFISKDYLQKQIIKIPEKINIGKGKKVNLESISANPTGPLHIGNGRNAFAGQTLGNVLSRAGYEVAREYYINDAKNSKQIMELGKTALGKGTTYLNNYLKSKISLRLASLAQGKQNLSENEAGYLLAQEVQKDTRDFLEKKLGMKFDRWVSEEEDIYKKSKVKKILDWLRKNSLVYEKDKAWWIKTSRFGDEKDWVVVRETGEPTYLLSDIAYHKDKFDRGFDIVIDIWGADHQAHVSKMKAVAKILGFKGALDILVLQLVALRGGEKMSKRAGNIILLEELIDEIGPDVAAWFYLQKSLNTHVEIDLELAKEQSQKNPVYYVQYAHARICSILQKTKQRNNSTIVELLRHPSELSLIKQLIRFPEVVEDTANDYQIQRLPQYATELAAAFHQFYRDCQVISQDKNLTAARLVLTKAAKIVLKNTLSLMGISAPEKM